MLVRFFLTCFLLSGLFTLYTNAESPSDEITFPDPALETAIRKEVGKTEGPLHTEDLAKVTGLSVFNAPVADLTGLDRCVNLVHVAFYASKIERIDCLAKMPQLEIVRLVGGAVSDISPLKVLSKLSQLDLQGNPVTDLSPLAGHTALRYLNIQGLRLVNYDAVSTLTGLEQLHLRAMDLADLGFVAPLTNLRELHADLNRIESLEPLRDLHQLVDLYLDDNLIADLSPLAGKEIRRLYVRRNRLAQLTGFPTLRKDSTVLLHENQITDIRPVVEAGGYTGAAEIELGANLLGYESFCRDIHELEARGNQVYFKINEPREKSTRFPDTYTLCTAKDRADSDLIMAMVNRGTTDAELLKRFGLGGAPGTVLAGAVFPDVHLDQAVRKALAKPTGPLSEADLKSVTELSAYQSALKDLTGIEQLSNLRTVNFQQCEIENLQPLASLAQLETLYLTYNHFTDISPLASLGNVLSLNIAGNHVTDLRPLGSLAKLKSLVLMSEKADYVEVLGSLVNLEELYIDGMELKDLDFVSGLANLRSLLAHDNALTSIEPLRNLHRLIEIRLDGNQIRDISPISGLSGVWRLNLANNKLASSEGLPSLAKDAVVELFGNEISDLRPLVAACGYTGTIAMDLGENPLPAEAFCRDIPELEARGNAVLYKYDSPVENSTLFPDIKTLCTAADRADGELVLAAVNRGATAQELQERFGIGADGTQVAQAQVDPAPTAEGEIRFSDANLEAVIREHIGKATGTIAREDLLAVTKLDATQREISDLSGLEWLPNLNWVNVMSNQIRDLGPLATLGEIQNLFLSANRIEDLSPLQNLQKLEYLVAADNVISRIEPLTKLPVLRRLQLSRNPITDMDTAKSMTGLSELNIQSIGLESLDFAAGFKQLLKLDARDNRIRSLEPLRDLRFLIELGLSGNQIEDIGPLAAINNLYRLDLADNRLSSLDGIPRFSRDATIRLFGNELTEIQPLLNACGYSSTFAIELGENALSADAFCRDIPELLARGVHVVYQYDFPLEKATLFPDVKMLCAAAERSDGAMILAAVNHGATQQQLEDRFGPLTAPEPVVATAAVPAPAPASAPIENPSAALAVTLADKSFDVSLETSGMDLKSLLGAIVLLGVCVFLVLVWRLPRRL